MFFIVAPIILSSFGILDREVVCQRHRAMRTFGDLRGSLKERVRSRPASNSQWLEMKRLLRFTGRQELYRKRIVEIPLCIFIFTNHLSFVLSIIS